jgi:hypothetical protein
MLPPIYVLCGDLTAGTSTLDPTRTAKFQQAVNDPNITGFLAPAPWNDTGFDLFTQVVAMSTKPFHVRLPTMPLPDGVPAFALNGMACGKIWDPAYLPLWQSYVGNLLALIQTEGLVDAFDGMRFSPVTPYDFDDEYGLEAATPSGGRNDAVFAAAGYTPSAYIAAAGQAAAFINSQPIMAGKLLSTALFTPGDQPRVNDAGQVVPGGDAGAVPDAVLEAVNQAAFICQKAAAYTTFVDSLPSFWANAGETLGNLIIQMHGTAHGTTQDQSGTGFAPANASTFASAFANAVALNPLRIELHTDQVAYLAQAIAALPPT